ncbi:T-cell surface antigen CD2 [Rhinolophus sinicus]|uniref:T-cell surface antigen CD2 n=1 Tax=Rhinolophus sinicus TaxID=89399 RepID=UPI003D7BE81E
MSFACHILASFLLIFICSTKGAAPTNIVLGKVGDDINLNIPEFQVKDPVDDIKWVKDTIKIAQYSSRKTPYQRKEKYHIFKNGTLKIKRLERNDSGTYKAEIYDQDGKNMLQKMFDLKILEAVSKPNMSWSCTNRTLTCQGTGGTDPKLKLYQNENRVREDNNIIVYKWSNLNTVQFKCTASNDVSEESRMEKIKCSEQGVNIYLILGICAAGVILLVFVALLILYISRRKKQPRRRNGEELDIRAHRITSEERSRKPHQMPGSAPQNPAASQPPPPPGHRTQAPGHRPPPPGHRGQHQPQHQPQKRPLPPSGIQGHQQKGPPLPRPRVQPKPPRGATENS